MSTGGDNVPVAEELHGGGEVDRLVEVPHLPWRFHSGQERQVPPWVGWAARS